MKVSLWAEIRRLHEVERLSQADRERAVNEFIRLRRRYPKLDVADAALRVYLSRARSPEQAIAIGLSKARRAGVKLPPPKRGTEGTKSQAKRDLKKGRSGQRRKPSRTRSRATTRAKCRMR